MWSAVAGGEVCVEEGAIAHASVQTASEKTTMRVKVIESDTLLQEKTTTLTVWFLPAPGSSSLPKPRFVSVKPPNIAGT